MQGVTHPRLRRRIRIDVSYAKPLIEYLQSLPQERDTDRPLTWAEDEQALYLLKSLIPKGSDTERCIAPFMEKEYRDDRTLAAWYAMARHVAGHLQYGE